jgi:membrane protease subunit (stomatin/prohibitin family)
MKNLHARLARNHLKERDLSLKDFLGKQFIDVIQWNEPVDGVLSYRYPMRDMEIQNGGQLTVRESQMAAFVNEGKIADVFGPGLHKLTTRNLPLLTDLMNWDKEFQSPFKSDVYFFSTRLQMDQKWGTATPITIRDPEFGAVSIRSYGIYTFRIVDPKNFFLQVSGTRDAYLVGDLGGQIRDTIVSKMAEIYASSGVPFLDMTANLSALSEKIVEQAKPMLGTMGLELTQLVVENISLPEELQKLLNQRIGMNMMGDMSRYTQYAAAESLPIAAANREGAAGMGMGLGAGAAVAQVMASSLATGAPGPAGAGAAQPALSVPAAAPAPAEPVAEAETKFCTACGKKIPRSAKFCPECGKAQ